MSTAPDPCQGHAYQDGQRVNCTLNRAHDGTCVYETVKKAAKK